MKIDRNTLVFFDASCLVAAAGSPTGGSGFLLSLCIRRFIRGAVSQPVLLEAQKNIQNKLGDEALHSFYRLLVLTPLILAPVPAEGSLEKIEKLINEKDQHVVSAGMAISATFILSLDRRLVDQINQAGLPLQALVPGDFIKKVLPNHVDYPSVRDEE